MYGVMTKSEKSKALPEMIRKEIASRANMRVISRMPDFAIDRTMPSDLEDLLESLNEAESERAKTRRPN